MLAGDKAFQLHDTYGFPIDLTLEMAAEQGLTVDEEGFRTLMNEQRTRAKADAAARKTGHGDLSEYRKVLEQHGETEFLGYTDLQAEAKVVGAARRRAAGPQRLRGQEGRAGPRPHAVLRRERWPGRRHRRAARRRRRAEGPRRPEDRPGAVRAPRRGASTGEVGLDTKLDRLGRRAPPPVHRALALRDAPGARGGPRRVRQARGAGGFAELAGPHAVRLHHAGLGVGGRADRGRAGGQRLPADQRRGAELHHDQGQGARAGRGRAVRREVRQRRPRGRHGRVLPRALRRHARRPDRPARPGQAGLRRLHRLGRAPRRGARRRRTR